MRNPSQDGIELSDAIALLHREMLKAYREGASQDMQFPVESMTVELKMAATRSSDGKAGFSIPVVNVELGGSTGKQHEATQTVTIVFGPPIDSEGNPLKVAAASDEVKE